LSFILKKAVARRLPRFLQLNNMRPFDHAYRFGFTRVSRFPALSLPRMNMEGVMYAAQQTTSSQEISLTPAP
jgi:hypothetical protein